MRPSLRRIRKERDLTQEQLADKIGCAVSTLSNYELGRFTLGKDFLEKLARVLDTSIEEITAPESGSRAYILTEPSAPFNANVEFESQQFYPPNQEGIAKMKQSIIDLAIELTDASDLMRRAGIPILLSQANELKKRLAEAERGKPARMKDEHGMPINSKIEDAAKLGGRLGAEKALREAEHGSSEHSPSGKADEPSEHKASREHGTGAHQKSQRSSPAPAPGSQAGSGAGQKK